MSMKSTRKILSVILIVIIAAGSSIFSGTLALKVTICNQAYMQRYLNSDEVKAQCMEAFDSRIDALAQRSGIPSRAFEAVRNFDEITSDSPVRRLFNGHDTTLYTNATIERFENLCLEYLEGNSIEYDETLVHNTAEEAARIYADCFGMKNTQELAEFINHVNDGYRAYFSISFLMIVASVVMLFLLYKKVNEIFTVFLSAFTAQGIALFFTSAAALISKFGRSLLIYPQIYADAVNDAVNGMFIMVMIFGFVLACVCVFLNVSIYKKEKKKNSF